MGKHDIGPEEIKDPDDAWKVRDLNEDPTITLKKAFQEHQKMNAQGLRLVLKHQELWDAFESMDEETKNLACEIESEFYAFMREQREFKPFTGDHSRRATALLEQQYKQNLKGQMFRGVKMYLPSQEDDMLLQLGNINNTIQRIQEPIRSSKYTSTLTPMAK